MGSSTLAEADMYLKSILSMALAAAVAGAPAQAGERVHAPVLRGAQCLDPDRALRWINEDRTHVLVDSGRYKYRISVAPACTALQYSQLLRLRGDPVSGRVCGGLGDAVVTRDYSCRIEAVELLSKEQYQQAVGDRHDYRKLGRSKRRS
jgi:hypothetical protein